MRLNFGSALDYSDSRQYTINTTRARIGRFRPRGWQNFICSAQKDAKQEQYMNRSKTDYYEIDLLRLAGALWKKLWLIVLVTLLCGALAFGYTFFLVTAII